MPTKPLVTRLAAAIGALFALSAIAADVQTDTGTLDEASAAKLFPAKAAYSPYAGRNFPSRPLFGDTHTHTSYSMDAGAFGCRLGPRDAFRFGKGFEITSSSGQQVKLSRPLDFIVVADHSDGFGFFPLLLTGDPKIMADPQGLYIVPNRVTVSTAGVVPRILDLATISDRPHLAISLAAPTDELRNELMPINKRWPLEDLLSACKEFEKTLKPNERVTFEYVMLAGVNDTDEHARQLANLLNRHGLKAKVNLIPHNPAEPLPYQPSLDQTVERFKNILESKGIHVYVRRPRGRDIFAACGQLAARQGTPININSIGA